MSEIVSQTGIAYLPEVLKDAVEASGTLSFEIPTEHLVEMHREAGAQMYALRTKGTTIETFYLFLHTAIAGYVLSSYQPTEKYRQIPLRIAKALGLGDVFPQTTLEHLSYWCLEFGHKLATGTLYDELEPDELHGKVVQFFRDGGSASTSALQREFKIGYARAARILEYCETENIIAPSDGTNNPRKVLLS